MDSLLFSVPLDRWEARGLAVSGDGRNLYYGKADENRSVVFYSVDLTASRFDPAVIATRPGGLPSIIPNPVDRNILLLNYHFSGDAVHPPQSHIELIDLAQPRTYDLDVRTNRFGRFTVNDHPAWNPEGSNFIFSAGTWSGEGDRSALTIWLYQQAH
jgi:hypothetical protein